jgi:hypothetical protein
MKMAEQNKITINDEEYDFDDLGEQSQYFVNQVRNLKARIAEARFNLDQLVAAEDAFSQALINSIKQGEKNGEEATTT